MLVIVSYDVSGDDRDSKKRLRHVAKCCVNHGQRVQYSVFECQIDYADFQYFKASLLNEIDPKKDSLRFYLLGNNFENKIEHYGTKKSFDILKDTMIL